MDTVRRYIIVFAGTFAALSALVLGFTLGVDPYGVTPFKTNIDRVNRIRAERKNLDRLVKPFDVLNRKPRTLILGTSRVKEGFDPADFKGTKFAPAYNPGIDFSSLTESVALLELLLPLNPQVKYVFLELNFIHFYRPGPVRVPRNRRDLANDFMKAVFSMDAIAASARTVLENRNYFGFSFWLRDDGLVEPWSSSMLFDLENFFTRVVRKSGKFSISSLQKKLFERISRVCRNYSVQCAYLILPYQPVDLAHLYLGGAWKALESVKRFAPHYLPTYDFTLYNDIVNETLSNNMSNWIDVNHFTMRVGGEIAQVLAGQRPKNVPSNFGLKLTSANIEDVLEQWRRGRDQWLRSRPKLVARIETGIRNNR